MIENTYENRDKLAELVVNAMAMEDLLDFAQSIIYERLEDDEYFKSELDFLGIEDEEEFRKITEVE